MERILADIRQEFGHRMSTEIVPYCETLLGNFLLLIILLEF